MSDPADYDVTPTVEDVIAEALGTCDEWRDDYDEHQRRQVAAVVAAVRAMTVEQLVQLRPDLTVERADRPEWFDTGKPDLDHLLGLDDTGTVKDVRFVPSVRIVGPWRTEP